MPSVSLEVAQSQLPELLLAAEGGDCVEIIGQEGRRYRLSPVRPRPPVTGVPRAGTAAGLFEIADDFDEPLDELGESMP